MTPNQPHIPLTNGAGVQRTDAAWTPDQGDGSYRNPVIWADYSDPDVIRHGDDFYLIASSFQCTPGLPILHSRDLVNWRIINHAVKNLPHPRYGCAQLGCGVWAPSIRFHEGRFWIVFAMPDEGVYVTTARDPAGAWSEPRLMHAAIGVIDPCPFWDDDGSAYLAHAYAHSRCGIKHCLRIRPMAPDASRLTGEGQVVYQNEQRNPTIEGPKLYKRNGWYYISAPAGGVESGWQTVLRSRDLFGPYEERVVLEQGGTAINGPHQGGLVDDRDGNSWFIHFQDAGAYGRITHLEPVNWQDDWPQIGKPSADGGRWEPVESHRKPASAGGFSPQTPQSSDEFDSDQLGLQWQWNANHRPDWLSLTERPGWARLFCRPHNPAELASAPNLLLQKFPAPEFAVETEVELGPGIESGVAGLAVVGREHAAVYTRREQSQQRVCVRTGGAASLISVGPASPVRFRLTVTKDSLCQFEFSFGERPFQLAGDPFPATPGVWIGARMGLYACGPNPDGASYADFAFFRVAALRAATPASSHSPQPGRVQVGG
ncbi:Beta-xylosidase [Posidoniimonas corsicana]|uniref:Beta-xylosidase n=1 Tax=Posidoniimonas corsicana TaxID=1938618 RepID=A0A5C5VBM5_9BACT|nr:glycoside hydrolase 43 family protein [Posidoniimonas corsicana]TWT35958.1 Beta-xylosidase [Posidoniimonas corsicana]